MFKYVIPLKHTCSWRDQFIVLWILNRKAKIFLRIGDTYFLTHIEHGIEQDVLTVLMVFAYNKDIP